MLLIAGGGCVLLGATIGTIMWMIDGVSNGIIVGTGMGAAFGGIELSIASMPLLISGKHKKENAYKVYNDYCAKPKATLSFGPVANGIGVCLSF